MRDAKRKMVFLKKDVLIVRPDCAGLLLDSPGLREKKEKNQKKEEPPSHTLTLDTYGIGGLDYQYIFSLFEL